ncbi:hypothetical protein L7F22_050500 [Adiantum nelumboides]|nr:hypothetical protein [Adiantum nelumboides]
MSDNLREEEVAIPEELPVNSRGVPSSLSEQKEEVIAATNAETFQHIHSLQQEMSNEPGFQSDNEEELHPTPQVRRYETMPYAPQPIYDAHVPPPPRAEELYAREETHSGERHSFDCHICLDLARDPVVTICGHLFCWPCIYRWLQSRPTNSEKTCPVCKASLAQEHTILPLYCGGTVTNRTPPWKTLPRRPIGVRPPTPPMGPLSLEYWESWPQNGFYSPYNQDLHFPHPFPLIDPPIFNGVNDDFSTASSSFDAISRRTVVSRSRTREDCHDSLSFKLYISLVCLIVMWIVLV